MYTKYDDTDGTFINMPVKENTVATLGIERECLKIARLQHFHM